MASATTEDYLKQVFLAEQENPGEPVPMGHVSTKVGVAPGTATMMLKSIANQGYLDYHPRVGVQLTEHGKDLALQTLRRHRILEVFLVEKLGLKWSEVHKEAELLEHTISARVLEALDEYLGNPTDDPHGSPIPTASGEYVQLQHVDLSACPTHHTCRITRICTEVPELLNYLESQNLQPGNLVTVEEQSPLKDSVTLKNAHQQRVTLSMYVARQILVKSNHHES